MNNSINIYAAMKIDAIINETKHGYNQLGKTVCWSGNEGTPVHKVANHNSKLRARGIR
jgi:hypothetical protein